MQKYPIYFTLKSGLKVLVRPLQLDDMDAIKQGFQKLTPLSRYYRFLSPVRALSKKQLSDLVNPDSDHSLALCVLDTSINPVVGIAVGRFVINKAMSEAEFALTILDEYQNLGLGSQLLGLLLQELFIRGVPKLVGYVHEENKLMLCMLKRFKAKTVEHSASVIRAEIMVQDKY